jgi:hypothetical protein
MKTFKYDKIFIGKRSNNFIFPFLILGLLLFTLCKEIQYQQVKKHFPNMSRWEYFIIEDKIVIMPNNTEKN